MPRRRNPLYSLGDINRMIDAFFHPAAEEDPRYWIADTFFHGLVEQNPELTLKKFTRYTLPKILRQLAEEETARTRRARRKRRAY